MTTSGTPPAVGMDLWIGKEWAPDQRPDVGSTGSELFGVTLRDADGAVVLDGAACTGGALGAPAANATGGAEGSAFWETDFCVAAVSGILVRTNNLKRFLFVAMVGVLPFFTLNILYRVFAAYRRHRVWKKTHQELNMAEAVGEWVCVLAAGGGGGLWCFGWAVCGALVGRFWG